jgi:diguanylate cyclase (GGDEF)-like protein
MFDGACGLPVAQPLAGFAKSSGVHELLEIALDEIDCALIVLDEDFQAEFINRAFHRMWALPEVPAGKIYSFADILQHGRLTGLYFTDPASLEDYVREQRGRLRLTDGRVLKFECKPLPGGRHLMSFIDISEFVRTTDQLRDLASIDDLTKIPNRRQFLKSLEDEFGRTLRDDRCLSVLMIDADNFKAVNDQHGHAAGDEVLRVLALRIRAAIRQTDLVGRLGGEEFAVALKDTSKSAAMEIADRLRHDVAALPFQIMGRKISVTVSIGVVTRGLKTDNAAELLRLADEALYGAKNAGRNCVLAGSANEIPTKP